MQRQRGFTLVELSIVLVVISLILVMAFKGRDLIYSPEIKAVQATSTKILAASNLYSERYGVNPPHSTDGEKNKPNSLLYELMDKKLLSAGDISDALGGKWVSQKGTGNNDNLDKDRVYAGLQGVQTATICTLDNRIDDGEPNEGSVRSNATAGAVGASSYQKTDDCSKVSGSNHLYFEIY